MKKNESLIWSKGAKIGPETRFFAIFSSVVHQSFGMRRGARLDEHMFFLTSQGAQNYDVHNVLLNLL